MKTNESNQQVVNKLNQLLSDLQVEYQNQRTIHWLVSGTQFYQLHSYYEDLYTKTADVIDEVAERILMLGSVPLHSYSDYLNTAKISVVTEVAKGVENLNTTLETQKYLLESYRSIISDAGEANDEGTVALMSELISSTEKNIWMLNATLA